MTLPLLRRAHLAGAPTTPPETHAALAAFFQGFGFSSEADLAALATWVLVPHGLRAEPRDALAVARAKVELWLAAVLEPLPPEAALLARGRAAFVLSDAARRGARVFTDGPESLPEDFARALRAALPVPTPAPRPVDMPEQRLVLNPLAELLRRWWRVGAPDISPSR
ncbi:hypothetical protein P2318_33655 [Myxococcaceae bacterium GXIMD 01537]